MKVLLQSGTAVSIQSVTGTGPWDILVNYQGANTTTRGFDLIYTNLTTPSATGSYVFTTACQQQGVLFTNDDLDTGITLVEGSDQSLTFPAIPDPLTTNEVSLQATASSGLPVAFSVASGPGSIDAGVLSFSSTGRVSVVASQTGNAYWRPAVPLTNTFLVFAGGTLTVAPTNATADSSTNILKFSFRADGIGTWGAGSQVRLTIPAEWPQPQTASATAPGYVSAVTVGTGGTISFAGIEGSGPWDVVVNYAGGYTVAKGFDLTYTNLVVPHAETVFTFPTTCRQFGQTFTNGSMAPSVTVVIKTNQSLTFPAIADQLSSNRVTLSASASSGLPVSFQVVSGPATLSGGTNLVFTSTGMIRVAAVQNGNGDWHPAPSLTNTFNVFAGGTMTVAPSLVVAHLTPALKFSMRADGIGPWGAGSSIRLTIPAEWPHPQTTSASGAGYVSAVTVGTGGTLSLGPIEGAGPWEVVVNYAGAATASKGFDLTYTNLTIPGPELTQPFPVLCQQSGVAYTNRAMAPEVDVIVKTNQTIDFPSIVPQFATNKVTLAASASSGLPVTFSVSAGGVLTGGTNLTFSNTGLVSVVASQAGDGDWHPAPSITNQFRVFAGGTLALTPAMVRSGSTTNWLKFAFRGDDVAVWQAGSQLRLAIPADWPQPQTNSATDAGYMKATLVSATAVSIDSISGTGPWDVVVNYQGAKDDIRGFDLAYTNLTVPTGGLYRFETECRQAGYAITNEGMNRAITVNEGSNQVITMTAIGDQFGTNRVVLNASAGSGLPVLYAISGPFVLAGGTNLTFSNTGAVTVVASQPGNAHWHPALSITNQFRVFAGGTLTVAPILARSGSPTNALKFVFRGEDVAGWQTNSQIRLIVPEAWPEPQTHTPSGPGYMKIAGVSAIGASIDSISGTGPWDVIIQFQALKSDTKGFDLTYTNFLIPSPGLYAFRTECLQEGLIFTNRAMQPVFTATDGATQTIDIAADNEQIATNKVGLRAMATSGFPVVFSVESGPGVLASGTNLSFTASGTVVIAAAQAGGLYWNPASTSLTLTVSPALLLPTATVKNKIYNGTAAGTVNAITLTGKAAGDTVSAAAGSVATFEDRNVGTAKPVTVSNISLTGVSAPKYQLTTTTVITTATITVRSMTLLGVADTKAYDGTTTSTVMPVIDSGSLAIGDTAVWSQSFSNRNVGTGIPLIPAGSVSDGYDGSNYVLTFTALDGGTITRRTVTVSGAAVATKLYDGTAGASLNGSLEGGIAGDDVTLTGYTGTFAQVDAGAGIPVTPAFSIEGADTGNYSLSLPSLTGTITPRPLTVAGAVALDKDYDGTAAAVITNAVLEGILNDEDVSIGSTAGEFARVEPGDGIAVAAFLTLTGLKAGNYILIQPAGLFASIRGITPLLIGEAAQVAWEGGTGFRLSWPGASTACTYTLQYADSLASPDWQDVAGCCDIPGSNGLMQAIDTNSLPSCRFYRLRMTTTP